MRLGDCLMNDAEVISRKEKLKYSLLLFSLLLLFWQGDGREGHGGAGDWVV